MDDTPASVETPLLFVSILHTSAHFVATGREVEEGMVEGRPGHTWPGHVRWPAMGRGHSGRTGETTGLCAG